MKQTLLAILLTFAPVSAAPPAQLPTLPLHDQFERPFSPVPYRGHVLVLLYGDRASTDANKVLGEYLHVTFHPTAKGLPPAQAKQQPVRPLADAAPGTPAPEVHTVAVACCGKVPGLVQGLIRGQIKSGSPEVPVYLDFADTMKTTFGQVEKVPNLVIVDRNGMVRYTANGPFEPAQMTQLTAIIERLRGEPVK